MLPPFIVNGHAKLSWQTLRPAIFHLDFGGPLINDFPESHYREPHALS